MKKFKEFKQKLTEPFATVDWKEFKIGMIVFLGFFTLIAIGMLVTKTWEFDMVLVYFFGGGFIVSIFFNLMNPNNQKKNE
jgi:hypothetical protein